MATRRSELARQYGSEKKGTLFSVGNGASRPIGCTEAASARAPLGGVFCQWRASRHRSYGQRASIRKGHSARQLALLETSRLDTSHHGSGVSLDGKQMPTCPH